MRTSPSPAGLRQSLRRLYSSSRTIQENDVVFIRQRGAKAAKWHLTEPLRPSARQRLSYGSAVHGHEVIGRNILDVVADDKGRDCVLHEPSMADYIVNSARMATPIYPQDASTIVSLLDLTLPRAGEEEEDETSPPFEIFEAGTGMGSLTLHISRAIHAANPAVPPALRKILNKAHYKSHDFGLDLSEEDQEAYDAYLASRRAILHTLDRNPKHSRGAHKLIRNFRRSLYFSNIDFHVGTIGEYISSRFAATDDAPFLSHAILDLPGAEEHADLVIKALHTNAQLIIFNPSISQIADFHAWVLKTKQPMRLEKVIELPISTTTDGGKGGGTGGKEWDVKTVIPRSDAGEGKMVQVMRPKVGDRVAGGGFVAVLRRWPGQQSADEVTEAEAESEPEAGLELSSSEETPIDRSFV